MSQQPKKTIQSRADIEVIIKDFYAKMLQDPIVGFIFVDVAKIDLDSHIPLIVDFWSDIVFKQLADNKAKLYQGNVLKKHLEINQLVSLKAGHFTRWLYLFEQSIDTAFTGDNADLMKYRAHLVADSINAAIDKREKGEIQLSL